MGISFRANVAVDMRNIDFSNFFYGTATKATSSEFVLSYGGGYRDEFKGHGFQYAGNGVPNGGRVETFTEYRHSKTLFSIDDLDVVVKALVKAASTDTLKDDANLIIRAMIGNDNISGSGGNDLLYGGSGADHINGRAGNDRILSGPGSDTMSGGSGADTFLFVARSHSGAKSSDTIIDFGKGNDILDFSKIGASEFIGSAKFSGEHGEIRFEKHGGNTFVEIDFTGDKKADFVLRLEGSHQMQDSDFAL